ncbi:hypothetical protein EV193_12211 [Herbihabitans rhizosphaerae]|uniref:Uncharacterized protein n=1 Tax=Herbihabitans rhizosphaerae TaxID=1872711 RepID=A0A4Q7KBI8_9PSEU|nr:hypothetical protein EV193_12211 [Herbihabitans rhizosphaerae]
MEGPIGMSEEKDTATMEAEKAMFEAGHHAGGVDDIVGVPPQMQPTPGSPARQGAQRRRDRVMRLLPSLPEKARHTILAELNQQQQAAAPRGYVETATLPKRQARQGNPPAPQPRPYPQQPQGQPPNWGRP